MALWTQPAVKNIKNTANAITTAANVFNPQQSAPTVNVTRTAPAGTVMTFDPMTPPAVAPVTPPVAPTVNVTRTAPAGTLMNFAPVTPSTDTLATPPKDTFSNTNPSIKTGYENVLQGALSGSLYDPMAAGAKEAMARTAANTRAAAANQIAGAGLSGTGIGQQVASGVENQLTRQKYDTLIGVEKARNEGRAAAMGEARAYGGANEAVRQYEQNFTEDKSRYGDTQKWKAYEESLINGSDQDVANRYMEATGRTLDPAAIASYRGAARKATDLALEGAGIANEAQRVALDTMKSTNAGKDLASYLDTHLDTSMSDPATRSLMQQYWDSIPGNTGKPMPEDWANQQIAAKRDVRLNTEAGQFNYQIDEQVKSGIYTPEQGKILKDFNASQLTQFLTRQPDGSVKFDTKAYLESVNGPEAKSGVTTGQGGVQVTIPKDASGKDTKTNGDYFYGEDGNLYKVEGGSPVETTLTDIKPDKAFDLYKSSTPEQQQKLLSSVEPGRFSYSSHYATADKIATDLREGQFTKISVNGKEIPVEVTVLGKIAIPFQRDGAYMEFKDVDGKTYYLNSDGAIKEGKPNLRKGWKIVGGNKNIE